MKKLAIGCGVAALLCALIIAGIIVAWPKISGSATGWFQQKLQEQQELARFEASWKPPTPEPSEQWFPEQVAGWTRSTAEAIHELPEVGATKDGYSATYMLNGQRIEVKAIPVTDLERDGVMGRAAGFSPRPENRSFTATTSIGNTRQTKYGNGERLYVRSLSAWFVLMHTLDGAEIGPFADAWLHAIDTQPAPATPTPEAPR
jgi:hypothetical protein